MDESLQTKSRAYKGWWNGRVLATPAELGGYEIPQGTEVLASIYHTHHMPDLYHEPERFNPHRWETISPSIHAYNPFSAGPRMCIGTLFAMMEIKIVLAMLFQRYRLECLPNTRVNRFGLITLGPKQKLPMRVVRQDRQFDRSVGPIRGTIRDLVTLPS